MWYCPVTCIDSCAPTASMRYLIPSCVPLIVSLLARAESVVHRRSLKCESGVPATTGSTKEWSGAFWSSLAVCDVLCSIMIAGMWADILV